MSFSYQEEVSNGVQTVYAVDFDFRNTNTIYVYAGEHNTYATQLSWQWVTGNTQIELTNLSEVPAGTKFYIRRIIDREQLTHTFENKSMRGKLIDEQNYAALYLMQEIMDGFIDRDNASPIPLGLDMLGQAITNLKDGINDTDAVTLGQAKNLVGNLYGRALVQLSTDPVPQPSTVNEGQRMIFIDTLDEFTLVGGMWVEDGNVGDEVDVTAASHLTLAQAQASSLKVGQYVRLTDFNNALHQVVAAADTGGFYQTGLQGGLKLSHIPSEKITLSELMSVTDESVSAVSSLKYMFSLDLPWSIGKGRYLYDSDDITEITRGGICSGEVIIPKGNDGQLRVVSKQTPTILDSSSLGAMLRGSQSVTGLPAFKTLYIQSNEIAIERIGNPSWLKQEVVQTSIAGVLTTPLVHTYANPASLTVQAWNYESYLEIQGLVVVRTGNTAVPTNRRAGLMCLRGNTTLIGCYVKNEDKTTPLNTGISVGYAPDIKLISSGAEGLQYNGLGYGLEYTATLNLQVIDCNFVDARHGMSGAYNVDCTVTRGKYHYTIDEHYGDRMVIDGASITVADGGSAVLFAGNDLVVRSIKQFGGRNTVALRSDTPTLGGDVVIDGVDILSSELTGNEFYVYGYDTPSDISIGGTVFTVTPRMPDLISIKNITLQTNATNVFIYRGDVLLTQHINVGKIELSGHFNLNDTNAFGIFAKKNSLYQTGRSTKIQVNGSLDSGAYSSLYLYDADDNKDRRFEVDCEGGLLGSFRFSPYSVSKLDVRGAEIDNIESDDTGAPFTDERYVFTANTLLGGVVSPTFLNMAFISNHFAGSYSQFPAQANVTMLSNVRSGAIGALPADIRNSVVAPYA